MSVIIFDDYLSLGADMTLAGVYTGMFDNAAANVSAFGFDITVSLDGDQVLISFSGENLTYTIAGDKITGITGGTISGIAQFTNGLSQYGVGSLLYSGSDFFAAVVAGDAKAQTALLTGGNDVILGNYAKSGDLLLGRGGKDHISGNGGNDTLDGGVGRDRLSGGTGDDRLVGGKGHDALIGGRGADSFVFDQVQVARNSDTVHDFAAGEDHLHLSSAVFTAIGPTGTLAESAFQAGTAALDSDDRVIYDAGSGQLWYDADGTGASGQVLIAHVLSDLGLTFGDVLVF